MVNITQERRISKKLKKKEDAADFEFYTQQILQDPMLFQRIVLDGLDEQVVGEEDARKCIFLCAIGSLVNNANKTSYNLMVNSESGAGKDHVCDMVLKIMKNVHKRTRISPTALTYWHNAKWDPEWTWDGKILYLEDCANDILNCDVFKVFTSGGSFATIVKDQRAIDIEIKGKPVIIITSASADPNPEMIRRFLVVNLNESQQQTKDVMTKWAENSITGKKNKEFNDYHEALEYLLPKSVKIPFAKKIVPFMNSEHIHMRTHFSRFMDLIKASAVLHQWQREIDSDGFLIAEQQDYKIAKEILLSTSSNKRMVPLTQNQQGVIERLKELGMNIIESESGHEIAVGWTHGELCSQLHLSRTQVYRELNSLVKFGFLKKESHQFQYDKKKSTVYSYFDSGSVSLPTWEQLF